MESESQQEEVSNDELTGLDNEFTDINEVPEAYGRSLIVADHRTACELFDSLHHNWDSIDGTQIRSR